MAVDEKVLRIVWAETSGLTAADGSAAPKERLQAVVGSLANHANAAGSTANFAKPATLPPVGSPGGDQALEMQQVVESAVATGQYAGISLPRRAVLWEVTPAGAPREDITKLPANAAWIRDGVATQTSDFVVDGDRTGRVFRLFESDAEPRVGDVAFVSARSGAGVPQVIARTNYLTLPWMLGIAAVILFFWMLISLGWSGNAVTQARDLMAGRQPAFTAEYSQSLKDACSKDPAVCPPNAGEPTEGGSSEILARCLEKPAQAANGAAPPPSFMTTSSFCQRAWGIALKVANSGSMTDLPRFAARVVSAVFGWPAGISERTGNLSLGFPMAGFLLSIALLGIALGLGTTGRALGIWISPENRISLARMQVTLWTMVVLGAYAAIATFNIGMLAEPIRDATAAHNTSALEAMITFPGIPAMILAALGIAVGSPMVSALIKGDVGTIDLRPDSQSDQGGVGRFIDRISGEGANLEVRSSFLQASLADIFMGETKGSENLVDVARLQNVLITFILVGGYAILLFGMVQDISPAMITSALADGNSLFPDLPNQNGIFTSLLAASHATYLVSKAAS